MALAFPSAYYETLVRDYRGRRDALLPALREAGFRVSDPAGAYYVMTDIRDLTDEDDTAYAMRLIREVGVAAVPGSSFYSRPELGRTKLRFAFPKRLETLEVAAARLVAGTVRGTSRRLRSHVRRRGRPLGQSPRGPPRPARTAGADPRCP